jgi:hypothetical protein
MLKENFLLEGSRIFGLNVRQARRHGTLIPLQIIITHLQFPQLHLYFLMLLPKGVKFALKGRGSGVMSSLKRHEF